MADLTITAASVVAGSGAKITEGTAGTTITAGQVVYLDSAANNFKLADCNSVTVAARSPYGIALHAAATGQPLAVQTAGPLTVGATLVGGTGYWTSGTPGGIRPPADNVTGDYTSILGLATSTTVLYVKIQESGYALL